MKRLLPLAAASILAAACNMADNDHYNNRTGYHTGSNAAVVTTAPANTYVVRPDGTYAVGPTGGYVLVQPAEVGYQPTHADDSLSDRSMGNTRGSHGEPMTHVDADNDGNYDFQPYYSPYQPYYGARPRGYYYNY